MAVNSLSQLARRFALFVTAILISGSLLSSPANAVSANASIYLTNFETYLDPVTNEQIVKISGEFINNGTSTIENVSVVLGTTDKFTSREMLRDFLDQREDAQLVNTNFSARLSRAYTNTKIPWQITFPMQEAIEAPSGTYGFGVTAVSSKRLATDVIAVPLFSGTSIKTQPTFLAVQLTTLNSHLASGGVSPGDAAELTRLTNLVRNAQVAEVSWIVDPALRQWLAELIDTELSAQAIELLTFLDLISGRSTPSIYSQPDIASLMASNRIDDLVNLSVRTSQLSGTNRIVIAPNIGRTSNAAIRKLGEVGIRPILSNKFIVGDELVTTEANSSIDGVPAYIYDVGLSECLNKDLRDAVNNFRSQNCVISGLALIAESESKNVLISTPANWNPGPDAVAKLVGSFVLNPWISVGNLNQLQNFSPTNNSEMPSDIKVKAFSSALIEAGDQISTGSAKTSSLFLDAAYSDSFSLARLRGFSSLWPDGDMAIEFLNKNEELLTSYQTAVTIDASRSITVSNSSTQIPITVANSSDRDISIVVKLTSPMTSRFTSVPSQVITVPSGKRVTIPMEITLTGQGILNVTATLFAPNGQPVGKSKLIQISSAEYQGLARTLVFVAFGLLVLLSISNFVKRRRNTVQNK